MTLETWLAFTAATIVLLVIPGPNRVGGCLLAAAGVWALLARRATAAV